MASIIQSFPKGSGKGGGHTVLDTDGVAVAQEENLQFTGLSVTDDSTNGITEVAGEGLNSDSIDDIASANSVVPAVIIGDANNYSTNEKVIGKWIDGKPLYQRTYNLNINCPANVKTALLNLDSTMDLISISNARAFYSGNSNWYLSVYDANINTTNNNKMLIQKHVEGTTDQIVLVNSGFGGAFSQEQFTLQYTKTT